MALAQLAHLGARGIHGVSAALPVRAHQPRRTWRRRRCTRPRAARRPGQEQALIVGREIELEIGHYELPRTSIGARSTSGATCSRHGVDCPIWRLTNTHCGQRDSNDIPDHRHSDARNQQRNVLIGVAERTIVSHDPGRHDGTVGGRAAVPERRARAGGQARRGRAGGRGGAVRGPLADRRRARHRQDDAGARAGAVDRRHVPALAVHARPACRRTSPACRSSTSARPSSSFGPGRSSPTSCWPTRSTAPRRAPSRRCSRRCRSAGQRRRRHAPPAAAVHGARDAEPGRAARAPFRCPRRSSTAS